MIFQLTFIASLLILILVFMYVMIKKYHMRYIYVLFVFALIAMINLDGIPINHPLISSLDILVTGLLFGVFLISLYHFKITLIPQFMFFVVYILNGALSAYLSPVIIESTKFLSRQVFFLLLMIIVMNYKMTTKKIDKLLVIWFKFSAFPASLAIIQVLTGTGYRVKEDIGNSFLTRGFGLTSHPNFLAYYLMMTLIIFLIIHKHKRLNISKNQLMLIVVIDLIAFMFTFCRGALIGLFIGAFVYFWKMDRKKLVYLPFLFAASMFIPGVGVKIMEMFDFTKILTDSSFSWRLANWGNMLKLLDISNIFIGNSIKSSIYYVNYPPHNEYVGFLFENGIIGFSAFYLFLWSLFRLYKKDYKELSEEYQGYFLAGSILGLVSLVVAISDNYFMVPSSIFYFWFFNGLLLNIHIHAKKKTISKDYTLKREERLS